MMQSAYKRGKIDVMSLTGVKHPREHREKQAKSAIKDEIGDPDIFLDPLARPRLLLPLINTAVLCQPHRRCSGLVSVVQLHS